MIIKLVTLEGCDRCERTKELLSKAGIKYYFSTCEQDPENCDNLESLVEEVSYPMILLTDSTGAIFEILFLTDSFNKLNSGPKSKGKIVCVPKHSVDNMLVYIKNKLNL